MGSHKNSNKKILAIIIAVAVIVTAILVAVSLNNKSETQDFETYDLEQNLSITNMTSYGGPFVEDGSDEDVSGILAITLKNNGTQTLQYAELSLAYDGGVAEFAFSTLAPGEEMLVLEKNRLSYDKNMQEISSSELKNVVFFDTEPTLCQELVEIQTLDGALNVKNISGQDITGRVVVYYKNFTEDYYLGGITYRIVIEDGIEAGGIKQVMTNHFSVDNSKIVFVTCEP